MSGIDEPGFDMDEEERTEDFCSDGEEVFAARSRETALVNELVEMTVPFFVLADIAVMYYGIMSEFVNEIGTDILNFSENGV